MNSDIECEKGRMRILLVIIILLTKEVPVLSVYTSSKATELRTALLMSYDSNSNKVRPQDTTQAHIGLNLRSITQLESVEQKLSATVWFTVAWTEERLQWTPGSYDDITMLHFTQAEQWKPEIIVSNTATDIAVLGEDNQWLRVVYNGTTIWEPARNLQLHCQMDLTYFPFDKHRCPIVVSTWSFTEAELQLKSMNDAINLQAYEENSEWELDISGTADIAESTRTETVSGEIRTYSSVTFYVTLRRRGAAYGVYIFLPLVLLSLLSCLVFVLPADTGDKANYSITMLLTVALFFLVILSYMPMSTHMPILVVYLAVVLVLVTLCIILSLMVVSIHHGNPHRPMSELVQTIALTLNRIMCKPKTYDDEVTDMDLFKLSNEPKLDEKPEKLSPLPNGNTTWNHHALPPRQLPPVEPILKRNKVRPGSLSSVQTTKSDWSKVHKFPSDISWMSLASSLDRLFLIVFAVVSFLVHFIFILIIAMGD